MHDALAVVEALAVHRPCARCDYFEGKRCKYWDDIVPESAQADGCEHFEEDVPF